MEQISVIIVNWNTGNLLKKCLASLASLPEQALIRHVVIIDNASSDTSVEQAKHGAQEHGYLLVKEKNNLGFAKANNMAWEYIKKHGGENDHILLLNPDTEVHSGAITNMLDTLNSNPKIGIVGPKLLETNRDVQQSVRQFPTLGIFMLLFLKLHLVFPKLSLWRNYLMTRFNYSTEQTVDQVMGAAFLIRNSVVKKIELLDEAFWIWFEEVDYCKRAKDAGWATAYTPSAVVTHHGGVSFSQKVGIAKTKPLLDSSLVYAKKHLGFLCYFTRLLYLLPLLHH
ncbi:MAG: glycosyltransferase family 2 protein [bacterium]|nr:glycosyltransferase family 2 protein [bacterium]